MGRKLKIILCVAVVILIALISFLGVYTKDAVIYKNRMPDILLSSEFKEKRIASFVIDDGIEEIIYDAEGKKVDSIPEGADEGEYTKEEKDINPEENRTAQNYKKVKEILDGRFKELGISEYKIRIDETTGDLAVELEENLNTDKLLQYIVCKGDFSITDTEDGTVLLDKNDIKNAKILYSNATSSGITVYLDIVFDKEGSKKLNEISKEYIKEESTDEESENTESDNNTKQVTLTLEGTDMLTTYFKEEITSGELTISLGTSTEQEDLAEYVEQGSFYAMLLNNPEMPITYEMERSETVEGNLSQIVTYGIIGVITIITVIFAIYFIARYKLDGVLAIITIISTLALYVLMARYTRTEISLNSIGGIILLMIIDVYLLNKILNSIKQNNSIENVYKATINTYLENIEIIVVTLIIGIIFTFTKYVGAYSFGMTLFYGAISIAIANLVFLRTMLVAKYRKD